MKCFCVEFEMKNVVFISVFLATSFLSAQMVVESPETDALLATQMFLINELAIDNRTAETERFLEYLTQFANVISAIKKGQAAAENVMKIGKELKNKSRKEWLSEVEGGLAETFPEMADFISSVKGEMSGEAAALGGKYAEYVSGWNSKLREYHSELLENYGSHIVFPELFPAVAESGKDFANAENAQKIVHKAWIESGMEYEMKNDAVRGEMFRRYYEKYLDDAKANDNIEALGLANLMQSSYVSVETLEQIRKNLDLKVMKEQFNRDSEESYMNSLKDAAKEKKKDKTKSVFGL